MTWKSQAELSLGSFDQRTQFWRTNVQLGTQPDSGDSFIVAQKYRQEGTYIDGSTGAGKSGLMVNLAVHETIMGHSVTLFDPHGDMADDIIAQIPLEHLDRVHLFDLTNTRFPFGFNPLWLRSDDP